jgi:two-component system cell cycle sensor histidine kinase/response regulator CckA
MALFSKQDRKKTSSQPESEQFIVDLALRFIRQDGGQTGQSISEELRSLAGFMHTDRAYIYGFIEKGTTINLSHQWLRKDIPPKIERHEQVHQADFSWMMKSLSENNVIKVDDTKKLSGLSGSMRAILESEQIRAQLLSPLFIDGTLVGIIGVDCVHETRNWTDEEQRLLRNAGKIFAVILNKKADKGLKQKADQKMRALFERTEDVIFISSPEGRIIEINPAGAKLFGYNSVNDMENINVVEHLYFEPGDRGKYQAFLENRGSIRDYELILKRKDGKKITVLETTTAVKDETGKIVAYEGIMRDVTEKRQLEQQLFQSQKMESIGLLAGGIAHDFNNILTAITGYADMILMDLSPDHPYYKHVTSILRGSKKAENLIKQLLAFSRKQIIEAKVISINQVITDIFKMLRRLVSENIHLYTELKNEISYIKADPVQLQQILVNLTVNAEFAVNDNPDKKNPRYISIITDEVVLDDNFVITHPGSKKGTFVTISVKDTGSGIKKELHQKIFEPFFTTKTDGKGTGLGLSTVYGIIKQNNAFIYVESEPGTGAIFTIYWPMTEEKDLDKAYAESFFEFGQQNETILVVEDDPTVRDMAVVALETLGYSIYQASNGREAMELVKKDKLVDRVDLLLTDIIMPEMDGMELARQLVKLNPKIKVLLSSGYTESRVFSAEEEREKFELIIKPYSVNSLNKKIRAVLKNQGRH